MAELNSARKSNNDHRRVGTPGGLADGGSAAAEAQQHTARGTAARPHVRARVWGVASGQVAGDGQDHQTLAGSVFDAPGEEAAASGGLVIWAITSRISKSAGQQAEERTPGFAETGLWKPGFPSPEMVNSAAALWEPVPWNSGEGPRTVLYISPGVISVRRIDFAKRERRLERAEQKRQRDGDLRVQMLLRGEEWVQPEPVREVTEWSADSVANMVERLGQLDWTPVARDEWPPAAITLTYPGGDNDHWLTVAPDGKTVKKHIDKFDKRYIRAWGMPVVYCWKFEFQRRGAPHYHLFGVTPLPGAKAGEHRRVAAAAELAAWEAAGCPGRRPKRYRPAVGDGLGFREWVAAVWSDIVDDPDPVEQEKHLQVGTRVDWIEGMRYSDPKRLAVYFSKHGSFSDKAYQNVVPEAWQAKGKGPGRFWGYKGLNPAVAAVPIDDEPGVWIERISRRWSRAQGGTKQLDGKTVRTPVTRQARVPRYRGGREVVESSYPEIIGLAGAQFWEAYHPKPRYRKVRRRVVRFPTSKGGFMCVNDAPAYASQLFRAVEIAMRPVEQGGHAPYPRRQEYLSGVNAVMVELGGVPVDEAPKSRPPQWEGCMPLEVATEQVDVPPIQEQLQLG